jgi:hypothetical protein
MAIYANTIIITGSNNNIPNVYANTLAPSSNTSSNIQINSDLIISGNMLTTKRMDVSKTLFATFRPMSNVPFNGSNELHALSNSTNFFHLDMTSTDMFGLNEMGMVIPYTGIFDENTGLIRTPFTGFYNLTMQGSFSNDASHSNIQNGVYYYFPNRSYSNARVSASITNANIISTNNTLFLLSNDQILPTFYTNDSNATLLANGETYVGFTILMGAQPDHSNYIRV